MPAPMASTLRWIRSLAAVLLLLPTAFARSAPQFGEQPKFRVTATFEPAAASPGDTVVLRLAATVAPGFHAYGTLEKTNLPVALEQDRLELHGLELAGRAVVPPGKLKRGEFGDTFPLPDSFVVTQPLRVPAGMAAGEVTVRGVLFHQVCDENSCLAPDRAPFEAKLVIQEPRVVQEPAPAPALTTKPGLQLLPDDKVTIQAAFVPPAARAGEAARLVLTVTVIDGWHAYGARETTNIPVGLDLAKLDLGSLEPVDTPIVPPGEPKELFGVESFPLPQVFEVVQVVRVPEGAQPGEVQVEGVLDYQVCDENSCDQPAEAEFRARLTIEPGPARAEAMPQPTQPTPTPQPPTNGAPGDPDNPFTGSWWALILASIGGGLFALAMPCTYPMIPITFSFFTKQAEKRGGKVLSLAIVYGLGIIAMFVFVGVGLSAVIQDVVNHWVTNTIIGVMFVFFAFVLFGWINLQPPQFIQNAAGKASATGGLLGVFFMGATLVITSFTCTAPIVGSLIANVAKLGNVRVGIGMGIFGLTMALPFVALALMPTKVKAMPRSGEWMDTLKISLGYVELAAALKFVSMVDFALGWQILPRELFLMLWTAIFGMWALFLFGILRKAGTVNEGVSNGRMAGGMAVTLLATYFFYGALGYQVDFYTTNFIPGYSAQSVLARGGGGEGGEKGQKRVPGEHAIVIDDVKRAIEVARADDKLLLYNFTGFN
jgi:thiol:disulfide interchange protein